jgi:hypothetical protein
MGFKKIFVVPFLFYASLVLAQSKNGIVSGPWAGNVELRNATIWVEVTPQVKAVAVSYALEGSKSSVT